MRLPRTLLTLLLTACPNPAVLDDSTGSTGGAIDDASTGTTADGSATDTPPTTGGATSSATTVDLTTTSTTTDDTTGSTEAPSTSSGMETDSGGACEFPPAEVEHGAVADGPFTLETLDLGVFPKAVCNDGSPAKYAIRPGNGPGRDRWVILLDGGGSCHNLQACMQRWSDDNMQAGGRTDMGSSGYTVDSVEKHISRGGAFSPDPLENPLFFDATMVRIFYCSSDLWSGDQGATPGAQLGELGFWHFRGRRILQAALADMQAKYALDDARELLFTGTSAGAVGVLNNIDEVAGLLPASIRMLGMPDAGVFIDYPAYDPQTGLESDADPSLVQSLITEAAVTWNGRGDLSCDNAAKTPEDRIRCYAPEHLLAEGHVTTPLLVVQSQFDINQTTRLGVKLDAKTGDAADAMRQGWRDRFAARMREVLGAASPWHGVWGRFIHYHTVTTIVAGKPNSYASQTIGDVTLSSVVEQWYVDPCNPPRVIEQP